MWDVIPKITTSISFAAFLLVILAYILKNWTKKKNDLIKNIPDKNRLSALKEMADNLGISAKKIESEELIYELVKERLRSQTSLTRTLYYLGFIIFMVTCIIVVIQTIMYSEKNTNGYTQTDSADTASFNNDRDSFDGNQASPEMIIKTKLSTSLSIKNDRNVTPVKDVGGFVYNTSTSLLQSKKIKIYYTSSTSKLGEILRQKLNASGAFTFTEKLLDNQVTIDNIIKFKSNRKDLAEYVDSSVIPEKKMLLELVDNSLGTYDLEIYLTD